jgi:hypothetical protein
VSPFIRFGLLLAGTTGCWAQAIAVGAIGGIRATGDTPYVGESKRYAVGPAVAVGLPHGFGIEVHAIYRREGYSQYFPVFPIPGYGFEHERSNSWEFPILAKYRLPLHRFHVEAGYAPRTLHGTLSENTVAYVLQGASVQTLTLVPVFNHTASPIDYPVSHGFVAGGGVHFALGRLSLALVIRYTHWNNAVPLGDSPQNQVDVLLGIGLRVRP